MFADALLLEILEKRPVAESVRQNARDYLEMGYQRLLTFESEDGGYAWYSGRGGSVRLSARMLQLFTRMARVHTLDESVVERTRKYLLEKQSDDGSWGDVARTAYVTWALAEAGVKVPRAVDFMKRHVSLDKDGYTLALTINAIAAHQADDPALPELATALVAMTKWEPAEPTLFHGTGVAASTEATALSILALSRVGGYATTIQQALNRLMERRSPNGTWGSTGTTILALRALMKTSLRPPGKTATIRIKSNGKWIKRVIKPEQQDLTTLIDLTDRAWRGDNTIEVRPAGADGMACQIVRRYAIPWDIVPREPAPLALDVKYKQTIFKEEEVARANVTMRYTGAEPTFMVVASLSIPPGFSLVEDRFRELISKGTIDRFEVGPKQVTLYFGEVLPNQRFAFSYELVAKQPILAVAPSSEVYEYYSPDHRAVSLPVALQILPKPTGGPVIRTGR